LIDKKVEKTEFKERMALTDKELSHFKFSIEDAVENGEATESYIERYLPITI
jgi:hypothetical protein